MPPATVIHPQKITPAFAPALAGVQPPDPFTMVIFGVTGDLAARKLLPAMYRLWQKKYLPRQMAVVGVARRDKSDDDFRADVQQAVLGGQPANHATDDAWPEFARRLFYHQADFGTGQGLDALPARLEAIERPQQLPGNRLLYLATGAEFFAPLVETMGSAGLIHREVHQPWARLVIEKPYGRDLQSALELDRHVMRFARPDQIYRIDHYLGKETVQNLLAFRFGNAIFEPLFNRHYVDQVQITVAESLGMEGRRGPFYDQAGALRDVFQNHLLQLLTLATMDPPATLTAGDISDAKLGVLRSLLPLRGDDVGRLVVRGQYTTGTIEGQSVCGYREEQGVAGDSQTETYVALRAGIENWRWAGVPFLLRTGKRLPRRVTEIAVQFKLPPLRLFQTVECEGDYCDLRDAQPSVLIFRIQPDEGISLSFSIKRPGMQLVLEPVRFEFDYETRFQALPEAYERLLLDALRGDSTLFMHSDELQAAWEFVTPILESWQSSDSPPPLHEYPAGTWGPRAVDRLAEDLGGWRRP